MKNRLLLIITLFVLVSVVLGSVILLKKGRGGLNLFGTYIGSCPVCNCLHEIPRQKICLVRSGNNGIMRCLICEKCQQQKR